MILRSYMFKRAAIVGVGLMGGSIGLALKKHNLVREVIGLSHRQSSLVQAMKIKAIDVAMTDVPKAIRNADLVILATPVESIIKLISRVNPHLKRGCIMTDIGSAKSEIVEFARKQLSSPGVFVGSHPLVGSEKQGVQFAQEDLFAGKSCIMTPTDETNKFAKEKIRHLWTKIGMNVHFMSPEEHDEALAYVSHLPHLTVFALMEAMPNKFLEYASSGLKDTTRIASSSPQMWHDIFLSNAKHTVKALDDFVARLAQLRKAIVSRDQKSLLQMITQAKEKRDTIG